MKIDKLFAAWATFIVLGTATLIVTAITVNGGQFPPFAFIVEHAALGLLIRASYKNFEGSEWIYSTLNVIGMIAEKSTPAPTASTADAVS